MLNPKNTLQIIFFCCFSYLGISQCPPGSPNLLSLPYSVDFSSLDITSTGFTGTMGLQCSGDYFIEHVASGDVSRLRIGQAVSEQNGQSNYAGLDVSCGGCSGGISTEMILTFNLDPGIEALNISFDYNDINDEMDVEDQIYIRGSSSDAWINILNWNDNNNNIWRNFTVEAVSILTDNNQTLSSSFQIRFVQHDNFSISTDGLGINNIVLSVPALPIPSLSQWGIIILFLIMLIGGAIAGKIEDKKAFNS